MAADAPDFLDPYWDLDDDSSASVFDDASFWSARFGALLVRELELRPDLRVLDVGCGAGFPLLELAHMHGTSCRFTGVDLWERALERAESKRCKYADANVLFVRADGARLPFATESFDLIVSNLGLNNFDDAQAALAACHRVARPSARLALTTNTVGHMAELYGALCSTLDDLGLEGSVDRLNAEEAHRATEPSLREWLESAGFQVHRTVTDRFTMRYLDGKTLLHHPLTRLGFLDGWRHAVGPEHEAAVFRELEERLDARAREAGALTMSVPMLYCEAERGE